MVGSLELGEGSFNISDFQSFVLVADIGGENTYLAVMGIVSKKEFKIILKQHLKTSQIHDLTKFLNNILEEAHKLFDIKVFVAVIAGAGIVSRNRAKLSLTNYDLEITLDDLKKKTMISDFILLNNFEAEGYGIDFVDTTKIKKISHNSVKSNTNTSAILGVGHGLGASIMYYDAEKKLRKTIPSEAGHTSLPVESFFDLEIVNYIRESFFDGKSTPISAELAISGKGICTLYDFLLFKKAYGEPLLKIRNENYEEKLKKIINSSDDIYCKRALELFVSYYARVARNLAMVTQPYSGIYLTGRVSIATKYFIDEYFLKEFLKCEVHKKHLEKIPIFLVEDNEITLQGGCNVAVNFFDEFTN